MRLKDFKRTGEGGDDGHRGWRANRVLRFWVVVLSKAAVGAPNLFQISPVFAFKDAPGAFDVGPMPPARGRGAVVVVVMTRLRAPNGIRNHTTHSLPKRRHHRRYRAPREVEKLLRPGAAS